MSEHNIDKYFDIAIDQVKTAGEIVRGAIKKKKNVDTKSSRRDLVTETDKQVEDLLISSLSKSFPSHKFIGEETVSSGGKCQLTHDPTWIIDPVDGTMNFVHSFPYTCISVALWINKDAEIGIIYNPVLEQLYTAKRGQGAYLNGERINVSGIKDINEALVMTELGSATDPNITNIVQKNIRSVMEHAHGMRTMGSAALNMCSVSAGNTDAYFETGIHAWDMAAGYLVVLEAGGVVCGFDGGEFNVLGRRILCAASPELAKQLYPLIETFEVEED